MAFLEARDLSLHYDTDRGTVRAVDRISFEMRESSETLGIIGETGSGKTSLLYALSRIYPANVSHAAGALVLNGRRITDLNDQQYRNDIRWKEIAIVFQAAMNGFNPVVRVGPQIIERALAERRKTRRTGHDGLRRRARRGEGTLRERAEALLESVGLPRSTYDRFPHELSGGMKQRAAIAMALILDPALVILDEPTSALDVSVQAQIMNTLKRLKWELGLGMIFITHDIALASDLCDRLVVMYAGRIRETGTSEEILRDPKDPYTRELLASIPRLSGGATPRYVSGALPDPVSPPSGCRFHPRCPLAFARCSTEPPPLFELRGGRRARCWLLENRAATDTTAGAAAPPPGASGTEARW